MPVVAAATDTAPVVAVQDTANGTGTTCPKATVTQRGCGEAMVQFAATSPSATRWLSALKRVMAMDPLMPTTAWSAPSRTTV